MIMRFRDQGCHEGLQRALAVDRVPRVRDPHAGAHRPFGYVLARARWVDFEVFGLYTCVC